MSDVPDERPPSGPESTVARRRRRRSLFPWYARGAAGLATVLVALAVVIVSLPLSGYLAWRQWRLRREIRRAWGDRPRVLVRREGERWTAALQEHWLRDWAAETLVLDRLPEAVSGRDALPLEWRVYLEWGPDYKFSPPPVAVVVDARGRVQRLPFAPALRAAIAGDDRMLREQFAALASAARATAAPRA